MRTLLVLAVLTTASALRYLQLGLNQVCKNGPTPWLCKNWEDCPKLKNGINKGQSPDVCSFQGRKPIICCPSSTSSVTTTTTTTQKPWWWITESPDITTTRKPWWWTTESLRTTTTRKPWWLAKESPGNHPVWESGWVVKPTGSKIETTTQKAPTTIQQTIQKPSTTTQQTIQKPSTRSKADEMCEVYSKYAYRNVTSPVWFGNEKPKVMVITDCNIETLVVGGENAKLKEFPHMALIGYGERTKIDWLCGGSLISPKFVLSAAHCTKPNNRLAKWVKLGELDTSTENDKARPIELKIIRRINHPKYNNQVYYNDIALYELEYEVELNTYIRPTCLQSTKNIDSDIAVASGWGHTTWGGVPSAILQKVKLNFISSKKCKREYGTDLQLPNGILDDSMICAGGQKKDTCQGDSGGPLQVPKKDVFCMYSQVGIVSFGDGCGSSLPGVYTRVSNYLSWIEKIVWP